MKTTLKIAGCGVVAVATVLCAFAEEQATLNVRGLEDDADNAVVSAPADIGQKPETVSISADAILGKASEAEVASEQTVDASSYKTLTLEGMVIPPSSEIAKTLEEAIRLILRDAGKQIGTVSSNGIDKLVMPYQQLGDGKSYQVEWRKALRHLLTPVGYNFTEDDELVLFGLTEEVDVKHHQLAIERLASNRTPILFTTNEAEGGMDLLSAIRDVSLKAGFSYTTDYMEPEDRRVRTETTVSEGALSAEDIGKAKDKAVSQQGSVKRTTYDTQGQLIEWRTVLKTILNPNGYDFAEIEGIVRIATPAKIEQWKKDEVAKKPLAAKVIRLYHADPEAVVERVLKIKGLLKHPDASLQATRKKDDNTDVVKNLNARIQTSSGSQSGQSDTTSQVFDKLGRPRTVPAVIAYDLEENLDSIEEKIKLFDIKEKQILIEAIIFQLDTDNGYEEGGDRDGVQWSGFKDFVPLYGTIGGAATALTTGFKVRDGNQVWMRTGGLDFNSVIQLIRQKENTKLLSSPMLVVGDHSEAAIQVSNVDPIPQVDASSVTGLSGSDNVQNSINIEWNMLRSGVLMWVSPEITESGASVRLTVHPQVVTKGKRVDLAELGGIFERDYPVYTYELKMHEMDTRATVPSGATLMFGGLIDNEEVEMEDKVRWLGDIPLLGWFFRSKATKIKQKNLVIMIRPTILEDEDETGFEANTFKEMESVGANSGRNLKAVPLSGPYTIGKTKSLLKGLYDERVVKPFEDWNGETGNGERETGNGEVKAEPEPVATATSPLYSEEESEK